MPGSFDARHPEGQLDVSNGADCGPCFQTTRNPVASLRISTCPMACAKPRAWETWYPTPTTRYRSLCYLGGYCRVAPQEYGGQRPLDLVHKERGSRVRYYLGKGPFLR